MKKALAKKLAEWEKAGLVQHDQVVAISKYEESLSENHWVLSGLMILGVLTIGIGVISLIAANWANIPNAAKLAFDFLALGGIGYAIYRSSVAGKDTAFNVWIVAMQVALLASIGLISQIYHSGGKLYQAILFWSLLAAPLSFLATRTFVPIVWMAGLLGSAFAIFMDHKWYETLFVGNLGHLIYSSAMFMALASVIARLFSRGEDWAITRAARFWTTVVGVAALFVLEHASEERNRNFAMPLYVGLLFFAIALFGILKGGVYNRIQRLSLVAMLFLFSVVAHLPKLPVGKGLELVIKVGLVVLTLGAAGVFAASFKLQKFFQIILALIGFRLLALYFQAFGGLAYTGVGLIVSGLLVISTGWLWNKNRKRIQAWVEEIAQ